MNLCSIGNCAQICLITRQEGKTIIVLASLGARPARFPPYGIVSGTPTHLA
jgi:hypothetical protein